MTGYRSNSTALVSFWRAALRRLGLGFALGSGLAGAAALADDTPPFLYRFQDTLDLSKWYVSEYAHKGTWIDTRWSARRLSVTPPGKLVISLGPDYRTRKTFASGEIRWRDDTYHGRYEAILKAARGSGLNTAFFTYTGPHRDDPKDEIDFEFLGQEPDKVWINLFSNSDPMPGILVDLGFDASAAPHVYAFEWHKDRVRWYADGKLLYEFSADMGPVPTEPGQIYLSLWAGHPKVKGWLGYADPETEAEAEIYCISFVPIGRTGEQCSDLAGEILGNAQ